MERIVCRGCKSRTATIDTERLKKDCVCRTCRQIRDRSPYEYLDSVR
jgi:hypothetical protein